MLRPHCRAATLRIHIKQPGAHAKPASQGLRQSMELVQRRHRRQQHLIGACTEIRQKMLELPPPTPARRQMRGVIDAQDDDHQIPALRLKQWQ